MTEKVEKDLVTWHIETVVGMIFIGKKERNATGRTYYDVVKVNASFHQGAPVPALISSTTLTPELELNENHFLWRTELKDPRLQMQYADVLRINEANGVPVEQQYKVNTPVIEVSESKIILSSK